MSQPPLRSGTCPSCGGKSVYTTRDIGKRGERALLAVSGFSSIHLDTYLCLECGHFEEVVPAGELASVAEKVRSTWTKA